MNKVAFYAPLKPPDHPIPSGDRLVAHNLMTALKMANYDVELASRFIAYSKREDDAILEQRKADALREAKTIIARLKIDPPDIWITYHPYCKAPDWIGPRVAAALDIPYITIEAAKTGQGFEDGGDRWARWRAEAQTGIRAANHHLCFKPTDRKYLTDLLGSNDSISDIPPFIDTTLPTELPDISYPDGWRGDIPVMVTTGMMRPGKKLKNFEILTTALEPLKPLPWNLVVIGDGPQEGEIRDLFSSFNPARILFAGRLTHDAVLAQMKSADLFVWPGWNEPIGMVYLEAQMMGLPIAALDSMGVPLTVRHGETGLLSPPDETAGLTENLRILLSHPKLRSDFGQAARTNVAVHHSLQAGAEALRQALKPFLASQ